MAGGFTAFGNHAPLVVRVWLDQAREQGHDRIFWTTNGFVSANENDTSLPVTRVTKLSTTSGGLSAVMPLVRDIDINDGVVGDNELTNNESVLNTASQTIQIDQLRYATKSQGMMAEQATTLNFAATARRSLAFVVADAKEELMFLTAAGRAYTLTTDGATRAASQLPNLSFAADVVAASTNRIIYAGAATSEASLTAADKMSWNVVLQARTSAQRKRLPAIRKGGKEYYALVMTPEQYRDLCQSADYKAIVSQAEARGTDNPLFNNARVVIGGVVIYDHAKVYHTLGGTAWGAGNTVHGAQAMLLGSQALGIAELRERDKMAEGELTDYQNRQSIAIANTFGVLKPQFPSKYDANTTEDYGIISVKTAAAASAS